MSSWPKRCARCANLIYPRKWNLGSSCTHEGRGLCRPCYDRCRKTGELADYRPVTYRRDELMDQWERFRLYGYSKKEAAAQLGMTFEAFDRAYHRARKADDPRAVPGWPERMAA